MTSVQVVEYTMRFIAVYLIIDSAEKLYNYKEFLGTGVFSWDKLKKHLFFNKMKPLTQFLLGKIFNYPLWLTLLFLRGAFGISLIFLKDQGVLSIISLFFLFIIGSLINLRNTPLGTESDNRLSLMIIGILLLRNISPTETVTLVSIWLIAFQSCLTYFTAGVTKILNKGWRDGTELLNIVSIPDLVPQQKVGNFFKTNKNLAKVFTWATIGIECSFPIVLFIGLPWVYLFLIWGLIFHFINAVVIRLNKFFWVWLATYPAIIFIAQ